MAKYYLIGLYMLVFTGMNYIFFSVDVIIGFCFFVVFHNLVGIFLNTLDELWFNEHKKHRHYIARISLVYFNLGYVEAYMKEKTSFWLDYSLVLFTDYSMGLKQESFLQKCDNMKKELMNRLNTLLVSKENNSNLFFITGKVLNLKSKVGINYLSKFIKNG